MATEPLDPGEVGGYASAYRTDLRPLGSLVVIQVAFESPVGTRVQTRSLQLDRIEEVSVAAPRIADSLVHGTPLANTAKIDTLVGQETRTYAKQYGETFFALGVLGFAQPDTTWAGYGVFARFHYEARAYAVGLDARIGGSGRSDGDSSLAALSVGGRYFLNAADVSPFLGGGAGILWLSQRRAYPVASSTGYLGYDDHVDIDGSGLAGFADFGVEFLRMHGSRLDVFIRADVPLFDLEGGGHHRYTVPVSLLASYSFD